MKKNGFIATSLIYSFFLIFITLFLTIIADYLQNKVLLNTIEKGIKDELNSTMGINDFQVGDILSFSISGGYEGFDDTDIWIVASKIYDYENSTNNKLILYSNLSNYDDNCLTLNDLRLDLNYGYFNNTYLKKLLYTFNGDVFVLDDYKIDKETNCISIENNSLNNSCATEISTKCRQRKELYIGDDKFEKNIDSQDGIINLTGVIS